METRKIEYQDDQYYIKALVHYTIDQEGDGIDYPIMTEREIEEIEYLSCEEYEETNNDYFAIDPNEETKLLIETEFWKL